MSNKELVKELNKFKNKLNKKQLVKFKKHQAKFIKKLETVLDRFRPLLLTQHSAILKKIRSSDPCVRNEMLHYTKYTLLKMKKPKKTFGRGGTYQGDPYTCDRAYFEPWSPYNPVGYGRRPYFS